MKVLYCNPVALDYRIPFYKKLVELFDGGFYFLYSTNRYKLKNRADLLDKIKEELQEHAIPYEKELLYNTHTKSFKVYSGEHGQRIPIAFGLLKKIRKEHPDVLITEGFFQWTPIILLYSIFYRKPVFIGYERTPWTERNTKWWKTLHRKLTDRFVCGYLVNGSETKKYLMSIGVKEEKIHIGGMSADSDGLVKGIASITAEERNTLKKKFQDKNGLVYLFSGQIVERKGVKYLLCAWTEHIKTHKDDRLVLVGYGDQLEMLSNTYCNVDSIRFEGKVNYVDIYKYYAIADVFVLPTIEDNWSLVVPEAMSCGLPVATSIYNGCHPELIHEGENGCTFDTFNQESMLKALDYFHHVDLKEHGRKSIEIEEEFNTANSARREYEGIMKGIGK